MTPMTHDDALKILELDRAACTPTAAIVTSAFRRAILANHPDTAQAGTTYTVDQIKQARQVVTATLEQRNKPCIQCHGKGRVPHKMGTRTCSACKGSGETT